MTSEASPSVVVAQISKQSGIYVAISEWYRPALNP